MVKNRVHAKIHTREMKVYYSNPLSNMCMQYERILTMGFRDLQCDPETDCQAAGRQE